MKQEMEEIQASRLRNAVTCRRIGRSETQLVPTWLEFCSCKLCILLFASCFLHCNLRTIPNSIQRHVLDIFGFGSSKIRSKHVRRRFETLLDTFDVRHGRTIRTLPPQFWQKRTWDLSGLARSWQWQTVTITTTHNSQQLHDMNHMK